MTKMSNTGNIKLQPPQPFGKDQSPLLNWLNKQTHRPQLEGRCTGKIVFYGKPINRQRIGEGDSKGFLIKETINMSGKGRKVIHSVSVCICAQVSFFGGEREREGEPREEASPLTGLSV